jgi:hypothetical protein
MSPPNKKALQKGAYGYGYQKGDEDFLSVDNERGNWAASASGAGYNNRWDDNKGYERGVGAYTDSDSGLTNKLPYERTSGGLDDLVGLDNDDTGMGSGNKLLGGGGPLTKGRGVGSGGPRFAPKTGKRTNASDY